MIVNQQNQVGGHFKTSVSLMLQLIVFMLVATHREFKVAQFSACVSVFGTGGVKPKVCAKTGSGQS